MMRAVAHNPAFAHKVDIPQSVGREFVNADKKKALSRSLRKLPPEGGVRG